MRIATIRYNELIDRTFIKFSNDFKETDWVLKLDILSDMMKDLEYHYGSILKLDWEQRDNYIFKTYRLEDV